MSLFIADASVAVKWYLPAVGEPFSLEAKKVHETLLGAENQFIAPDLLWVEFGNVMWRSVRRGRLTHDQAKAAVESFGRTAILSLPSQPLVPDALRLALAIECTVYDCLYVALAVETGAQLITADRKLFESVPPMTPVQWVGSF